MPSISHHPNLNYRNAVTGISLSTKSLYKAKAMAAAISDNSPPPTTGEGTPALAVACTGTLEVIDDADPVLDGDLPGPAAAEGAKIVLLPPETVPLPLVLSSGTSGMVYVVLWHVGARARGPLKDLMGTGRTLVQSVKPWILLTPRRDRRT